MKILCNLNKALLGRLNWEILCVTEYVTSLLKTNFLHKSGDIKRLPFSSLIWGSI